MIYAKEKWNDDVFECDNFKAREEEQTETEQKSHCVGEEKDLRKIYEEHSKAPFQKKDGSTLSLQIHLLGRTHDTLIHYSMVSRKELLLPE